MDFQPLELRSIVSPVRLVGHVQGGSNQDGRETGWMQRAWGDRVTRKLHYLPSAAEQTLHTRKHAPHRLWIPQCISGQKANWHLLHLHLHLRVRVHVTFYILHLTFTLTVTVIKALTLDVVGSGIVMDIDSDIDIDVDIATLYVV